MPRPKGQITRLKNGVWQMRVQRIVEGKRKSVSKRFTSRSDAEDALESLLDQIHDPAPDRHTCKELFDAYIKVKAPELRIQTVEYYERNIRTHLSEFNDLLLIDLTSYALETYFARKRSAFAPATVSKTYTLLKAMLKKAVLWNWIAKNPMEEIKPPKKSKKAKEVLTPDELYRFFDKCGSQETQWTFAALTGCRAQEIFGAKWADIDFDNQTFTITQVLVRLKNRRWLFGLPKTESSARVVPLSAALVEMLKKHKVEQNKRRLFLGDMWADYDLVFPTSKGKPQRISNIGTKLKQIAVDAGITKNVHPHLLRHGFISLSIDNGMDLKTVSEMVGHSSVEMTLNIYKQTKFEDKRNVADSMADLILKNVRAMGGPGKTKASERSRNKTKTIKLVKKD